MSSNPQGGRLRFAAPAYANSTPLFHFIPAVSAGAVVSVDYPSTLMARLLDGRADAALVPVFDLLTQPGLAMIDGLGVCSEKEVQSVLIKCYRPLAEVRTVALDAASHTSNALAAILLRRHFRLDARMVSRGTGLLPVGETPIGEVEEACGTWARRPCHFDAAVVIGDRALCDPPGPCGDYDMARCWNELTGLPFVFAAWCYRAGDGRAAQIAAVVHKARQAAAGAMDELIELESRRLGLPPERCRSYFGQAIYYDVGPREMEAIRLFGQFLREDGLGGK
jgi:chorismate dehydratase